jgi:hypothetical protein
MAVQGMCKSGGVVVSRYPSPRRYRNLYARLKRVQVERLEREAQRNGITRSAQLAAILEAHQEAGGR